MDRNDRPGSGTGGCPAELGQRKVLIAEDEAIVAMNLCDIVEDLGGEVVGPFARVAQCIAALDEGLPDLAILDLRLEDGSSIAVAEKLAGHNIPIVFHSGHMDDNEWQPQPEDTPVYYCSKPCPSSDLEAALLAGVQQAHTSA